MKMQRLNATLRHRNSASGFSAIEVMIIVAVVSIITGFAALGITRARASMRLSGAAREFAAYVEKARVDSIRRHAEGEGQWASVTINPDRTSYTVTFAPFGTTMITRTIPLPSGVSFDTEETIAFDWRGRTQNTVGGVTTANAQVSITMRNSNDFVSVDVTGSGDITMDSRVFDDSVPNVNLNVDDLTTGATPTPSATPGGTPVPVADGSPTPLPSVTPLPTPDVSPPIDVNPLPSPSPIVDPLPSPSPGASPQVSPSPSPAQIACNVNAPDLITMSAGVTTTVGVAHTSSGTATITGASSKPSDLQVTPGGAQTVSTGTVVTFTLKSKRDAGTYTVTFTSDSCAQAVLTVKVQ